MAESPAPEPSVPVGTSGGRVGGLRWLAWLPRGSALPLDTWRARHRVIVWALFGHLPVLFALGVFGGVDRWISFATIEALTVPHTLLEIGIIAAFGVVALMPRFSRRLRSVAASMGLVTCSAILTHFSGGYIEAHFHFFVVVAVIAMYQHWIPFLMAILYVAIHHGTVGTLDPSSVFNHPAAIAHPWRWALIHAFFIVGISVAEIASWRMREEATQRTETVLRSAGDGIIGLDAQGKITFANPAAAGLSGRAPETLIGQNLLAALPLGVHGPDDENTTPLVTLRTGQAVRGNEVGFNGHGSSGLAIDWMATPMRSKGRVTGAVVTIKDVTEMKNKELELQRSNQELEQFAYVASHDLQDPLRVVTSYVQVLEKRLDSSLDEKTRRYMGHITASTLRMQELINDLLEYSRMGSGSAPTDIVTLDDVVQEALVDLEDSIRKHKGEVASDSMPSVVGDARQLKRLIQNLVGNALKYHREGVPPRIHISATENHGQCTICVTDNGIGIEPASADRIFLIFQRLHGQQEYSGTGIGLAICKKIVEHHGGRIWVEPNPDGGSRFFFTLPKASTTAANGAA